MVQGKRYSETREHNLDFFSLFDSDPNIHVLSVVVLFYSDPKMHVISVLLLLTFVIPFQIYMCSVCCVGVYSGSYPAGWLVIYSCTRSYPAADY